MLSKESKSRASGDAFNPAFTREWVQHEIADSRITGCSIEVFHKGKSALCESFGSQNSNGDPVTRNTRYWIASMSKPVVSIAAFHLIERAGLSLDDPVSKFIPGFGDAGVLAANGRVNAAVRPPLIKDLFTHTSGVTYGQFGSNTIHQRYKKSGVFDYASNNAEMAARLSQLPLLHQPGTTFEYGMSTDLLGRVLEVLTADSLDKVLEDIVLGPLGMTCTSFLPDSVSLAEMAPSPVQANIAPDFSRNPTWFSGGAGLFSTVPDYMRFARLLLGRGEFQGVGIVNQQSFARMCQSSLPTDVIYGQYTDSFGICAPWEKNGLNFGLGLAVRTKEIERIPGGLGEFFWPGVSGGNFWVDPKNDLIVVFLTHAPMHRTTHRVQLRNAVYHGLNGTGCELTS